MRILLVHPGASWSIHDVWRGYDRALRRAGHEVVGYSLGQRIEVAAGWLRYCWERAGKQGQEPTQADTIYLAGQGILERALRHRVDWVLVVSAMYLIPEVLTLLREAGKRVAIMLTESPYEDEDQAYVAELADVVFTNERTSVPRLAQACARAHYLPHAFDPEVHSGGEAAAGADEVPAHDVVFVGTGFEERCDLLSAVDWNGADVGLYGEWGLVEPEAELRRHIRGGLVPNEAAAEMYRRARMGLNLHRTSRTYGRGVDHVPGAESVGPRVLELAAAGGLFVSDWRPELGEIFGDLVPTFRDAGELGDLVRFWLAASASQQSERARLVREAVRGETFGARVPIIERALSQG